MTDASIGRNGRVRALILVLCFGLCFAMGFVFHKYGRDAYNRYVGVSLFAIIKSPLAYGHIHERGWSSFQELRYTQDHGGLHFRRYVETALLPLIVDGKRLSDFCPVPKMGGAITVVGTTVIILDRLGGLYRYDLATGSFGLLPGIPRLPNNLESYLVHRPGPPVNLAEATNDEFRARDIIFLQDQNELAVSYDKYDETLGKLRTVVSVIPFEVATLTATGAWRQIFASDSFGYGAGITSGAGMLAYRGDGKLYLTIGDHFIVKPPVSEDPTTTFGKTIEIDLTTNKWRIFSKGHRNQEGLAFLKSGQLLSTEDGPRGGDDLDYLTDGSDFGWPNVSLGTDYNSYVGEGGAPFVDRYTGYTAPLLAWVPSIAPTQLMEVTNFNPRWNGDLLVATLKSLSLYRLRLEAGRVLYSERIWIGQRIRDISQTSDGTIVLWTDDSQLLFVTVDKDQLVVGRRTPNIIGSAMVNENCLGCHHFGATNPADFAPSLSNLLDRPIASDTFPYSAALRAKQQLGHWTPALLAKFLSDPFQFAAGTTMLPLKLSPAEIQDIVAILVRASAPSGSAEEGKGEGYTAAQTH